MENSKRNAINLKSKVFACIILKVLAIMYKLKTRLNEKKTINKNLLKIINTQYKEIKILTNDLQNNNNKE